MNSKITLTLITFCTLSIFSFGQGYKLELGDKIDGDIKIDELVFENTGNLLFTISQNTHFNGYALFDQLELKDKSKIPEIKLADAFKNMANDPSNLTTSYKSSHISINNILYNVKSETSLTKSNLSIATVDLGKLEIGNYKTLNKFDLKSKESEIIYTIITSEDESFNLAISSNGNNKEDNYEYTIKTVDEKFLFQFYQSFKIPITPKSYPYILDVEIINTTVLLLVGVDKRFNQNELYKTTNQNDEYYLIALDNNGIILNDKINVESESIFNLRLDKVNMNEIMLVGAYGKVSTELQVPHVTQGIFSSTFNIESKTMSEKLIVNLNEDYAFHIKKTHINSNKDLIIIGEQIGWRAFQRSGHLTGIEYFDKDLFVVSISSKGQLNFIKNIPKHNVNYYDDKLTHQLQATPREFVSDGFVSILSPDDQLIVIYNINENYFKSKKTTLLDTKYRYNKNNVAITSISLSGSIKTESLIQGVRLQANGCNKLIDKMIILSLNSDEYCQLARLTFD